MIHWLVKFFQNYSGYRFGWHTNNFAEVFGTSADSWEPVAICFIAVCSIFLICNIVYFLTKSEWVLWKVYIPLIFLYLITNIIFQAIICCLLLSLGPGWWIGLGIIYCVVSGVINGMGTSEYDPWPGYFGFMGFVIQYSENCKKYAEHKKQVKQNYEHFLAIKYE